MKIIEWNDYISEDGTREVYFALDKDHPYSMPEEYMEEILRSYDCIVPNSELTECASVREFLEKSGKLDDFQHVYQKLVQSDSVYKEISEIYLNANWILSYHMMLASEEIVSQYSAWLSEMEFDQYDRDMLRHVLRIWLLRHAISVREELVKRYIPKEVDNKYRELQLKKRYVSTLLKNVITYFQEGNTEDLVDSSPLEIGLDGKIPVWVCWWQGEDKAPEIVKKCIARMRKTLPEDFELRLITMENVGRYITLPQWIIEKYGKGIISLTHLSDVLRFGLLYRYGGLWLDATYYVMPEFWSQIRDAGDFFVCKLNRAKWTYDISEGRWASNVFYGKPGNFLFKFMLNAYYEHWKVEDELIDYYLMDYMIAVAYDSFDRVREMIDGVEVSNLDILTLADILGDKFEQSEWDRLRKDTHLFKLTYKKEFPKHTIVGEKTYYDML